MHRTRLLLLSTRASSGFVLIALLLAKRNICERWLILEPDPIAQGTSPKTWREPSSR